MDDRSSPPNDDSEEPVGELQIEPDVLDASYVSKITEHINRKAVIENDGCPVCGSPLNTVSNTGYKLTVKEKKGALESGREMPLLATVCHNCGFTRFFNRIIVDKLIEFEGGNASPTQEVGDGS